MTWRIASNNRVAVKVLMIGLIVVVLMIPLSMLRGLIAERTQMRDQAYAIVATGWGGRVTTGGPILCVPFDTSSRSANGETTLVRHELYILPSDLQIDVQLTEESAKRHVGIYEVPVYLARVNLSGSFSPNQLSTVVQPIEGTYHWNRARLRWPLSDVRSVRELTRAHMGDRAVQFGPAAPGIYHGLEAGIDLTAARAGESISFQIEAVLAGSRAISILPTASTTKVAMHSNWPDPQFEGAFLPTTHSIDKRGFTAQWQVLELNRAFSQSWVDSQVDEKELLATAFGASLYQVVDVYQRSERAVKYALMFIALTFLSFYAWELLSGAALHPMQYLLVGLALSTFYLLLIALTEHVAFWLAYGMAAAALISLLGFYIAGAMRSGHRGLLVAGVMALVYGSLFVLVLSESYALLMGAIVLFCVLATVMLATRRVQWYASEQ